jgi:serine protease Do
MDDFNQPYNYQRPDQDQYGYVYPHQGYGSTPNPGNPAPPPRQPHRVLAFAAAFLAVAIIFSAVTAGVVYTVMRTQPAVTQATTRTGQSSQSSQPGTGSTTTSSTAQKHFSIADAATKPGTTKEALSIMKIAAQGKPAVVAINTETTITDPFGQSGIGQAAGSGFILTADGYIVTNFHVIDGSQKISVTLDSGKIFVASVVGSDSQNDIAVLKIDSQNLPTVVLGYSDDLEVGELAVAIGNPLGKLSGTVTAGIISALDREITIDNQTMKLLQTDAAINAGNSGGALFNSFGEVIGINTAKNAGTGIEGLGFAIPIDHAKPIIESLINYGYVQGRPKMGVYTEDITAEMADFYNLHEGVYVVQVATNGAADKAGIKKGDIIIAANGQKTLTTEAVNNVKANLKPGDVMKLTIVRDGKEIQISLTLEEDVPDQATPASVTMPTIGSPDDAGPAIINPAA